MYCGNCGAELAEGAVFCSECGSKTMSDDRKQNRKCCVCGSADLKEEASILFIDADNNYKELCDKCDSYVAGLENNNKEAMIYLENMLKYIDDEAVRVHIKRMISNSKCEKAEMFVNEPKNSSSKSIWISVMKFVAWLLFWGVIIAGIVTAFFVGIEIGFCIILGSIPLAFFLVAGMMIFLEMAEDIRSIKNELKRK